MLKHLNLLTTVPFRLQWLEDCQNQTTFYEVWLIFLLYFTDRENSSLISISFRALLAKERKKKLCKHKVKGSPSKCWRVALQHINLFYVCLASDIEYCAYISQGNIVDKKFLWMGSHSLWMNIGQVNKEIPVPR